MSHDICKVRTHGSGFGPSSFQGLVVLGGVDGEFAQELPGDGVDDSDVEVLDDSYRRPLMKQTRTTRGLTVP